MIVYIAGKISGDKNYKRKFEKIKAIYNRCGFTVLNPAELPYGMNNADYMRICMSMIDTADVISFLPDYKNSKGAIIERLYAEYIGKEIVDLELQGL